MELVQKVILVANNFAKRLAKDFSLSLYLPAVYRKSAKLPVDPSRVIFLENKDSKLPDAYKMLFARLVEDYTFDVGFVSLGQNRVRLLRYYYNCRNAVKEIATAKYVFLNDASDLISCLPLREETKVVQLWHACGAFKKWGMSTADLKFGGTRKDLLRHPFYKNLSLVTVSSPEVCWAYVEAMVLEDRPEIVKPIGVSRTDVFFDEDRLIKARERVNRFVPYADGKRIILYAPTFRGRVASAEGPDRLDIVRFKETFGEDSVLLVKHHPFVKKPHDIPEGCKDFAYDVSGDLDIDELLSVADVCISDYSSLVFEYSLFGRPMIFFAYDIDEYNDWRGFYYDYDELTPGPVFSDNDSMIDYLQHLDERFDIQQVRAFRNRFMSACDGRATERICEVVFGDALETYRKPSALEVLSAKSPGGIDISIVIPVCNAMPEFRKTLESLVGQTYDLSRMEVIVTDDCSLDGTWDEVRRFAASYPDLFVLERLDEPSGSPAKPRNVGLEKARGTYVFFLDADDWLGERAVEKMLDHAVEWDSDVLLVKMKGENGRDVPKSMFTHNQPKVDVSTSKVMWSIGPLKLFRRGLLEDHGLRFFEEGMPEDLHLVIPALRFANVVSVASDYDYYHVSWREDEKRNTSNSIWTDYDSNMRSYTRLMSFIGEHFSEAERNAVLMRRIFRLDVLNMLKRLSQEAPEDQERHLSCIKKLFGPYYVEEAYKTCPLPKRLILDAAFFGDMALLATVIANGEQLANRCLCEVIEKRILCSIPESVGALSLDVSEAVSLNCAVDRVDKIPEGIELSGSFVAPSLITGMECYLLLKRLAGVHRVAIPMLIRETGICSEVESGIPSVSVMWSISLSVERLFKMASIARWELYLVCRVKDWEKATRLGLVCEEGAERAFASIELSKRNRCLSCCLSDKGGFVFDIKWMR